MIAYLLVFAHVQQILAILAPVSLVMVGIWSMMRYGLIKSLFGTHILIITMLAYVVGVTALNYPEMFVSPGKLMNFIALEARIIYTLLMFFIFCMILPNRDFDKLFFRAAIIVTAGICLFSLLSFITTPLPYGDQYLGARDGWAGRRPVGLLGGKNPFSGSLGPILIMMIILQTQSREFTQTIMDKKLIWIAIIVTVLCLMLAGSLGFTLGIMAALAYILFTMDHKKLGLSKRVFLQHKYALILLGIVGLTAFVMIHGQRVDDVMDGEDMNLIRRLALFAAAFERIQLSPLTGLGPSSFREVDMTVRELLPGLMAQRIDGVRLEEYSFEGDLPVGQHTHNFLLQILTDVGLIGAILLGSVFCVALNMRNRIIRIQYEKSEHIQFCTRLAWALMIYLAVSGLAAGFTFISPTICWLFYFVLARIVAWKAFILWRAQRDRNWQRQERLTRQARMAAVRASLKKKFLDQTDSTFPQD